MSTQWDKLIQIDRSWVDQQLEHHFKEVDKKINIKLYTVKVSGTQILPDGLVETLHEMLPDYVYNTKEIASMGQRKAGLKANHFFGKKDPKADGKYGELLLFALVESVLGCKMVAHKLRSLSNFKDQVKGGDGIFLGNYQIFDGRTEAAYLIGESKIMGQYSKALTDALDSVNRFCSNSNSPEFRRTELIVAKENLFLDDAIDIDELYDRLTPTTELYKSQILVHPILLMYDDRTMKNCERENSATRDDLEASIRSGVAQRREQIINFIKSKVTAYPEVAKVYLDFFLVPYNDVDTFRDTMYYHIHGVTYPRES